MEKEDVRAWLSSGTCRALGADFEIASPHNVVSRRRWYSLLRNKFKMEPERHARSRFESSGRLGAVGAAVLVARLRR